MSGFTIIDGDVVLRDSAGNELSIADAAALSATKGLIVAGSDGTNARFIKVAADGTVAISATALPLPAGAATEATLVSLDSKDFATQTTLAAVLADTSSLDAKVDVNLSTRASEATLSTVAGDTSSLDAKVDVNLSTRASEATLSTVASDTTSLDSKFDVNLSTRASEATLAALETKAATETTLAAVLADTSSLDSKFDVNLSTRASEATLSSVESNQTNGSQKTQVIGADGTTVDVNTDGTRTAIAVEYPEMIALLARMSAQLEKLLQHMAVITDESPEEPLA